MAKLTIVMWRDIPAQVIVKQGRNSAKRPLEERFEKAIDKAAMRAGLYGSDGYLSEWRRDTTACGDDLEAILETTVNQIQTDYTEERLAILIAAGGIAE
ncbi:MAG: virulence factor [Oceanospirillaceae bacterium]|mgnify:FL=1|nr:virulence factor [Pseudomonadales bacterium]